MDLRFLVALLHRMSQGTRGAIVRLLFVLTVGATGVASTRSASLTTEIAAIVRKVVIRVRVRHINMATVSAPVVVSTMTAIGMAAIVVNILTLVI